MKDRVRVEVEPAEELSLRGGEIAMAAMVRVSCPAPEQNEHLPYRIEMMSQAAGLEFMRKFFGLAIEKADLELFVSLRSGKDGDLTPLRLPSVRSELRE